MEVVGGSLGEGGGWAGVVDGFGSDLYHRLSLNGHL